MYFLGVSKKFSNYNGRFKHKKSSGNIKVANYLREDWSYLQTKEGFFSFYFKKYFKPKWKRRKFICDTCFNVFQGLIKNDRQKVKCPYCEEE